MSATRDDFERAAKEEEAFIAPQKALHHLFFPSHNLTIQRSELGTQDLRDAGEAYNAAQADFKEIQAKRRAVAPKAAKLGRRFGLNTRGQDPEKVANALGGLEGHLARPAALEASEEEA